MSQAQPATDPTRPELAEELPVDPEARAETRARAAESVAAFAQSSALAALDALFEAVNYEAAARTAAETTERTELLDTEVRRFRALADQTS
ncbi:hypothetical protein [Rhodovibrio salinarum]|uniref:Uncharacterized protein n=1 Tax=Rhodovibrio salinarum TaxID=1087 RepID=A0A934V077_9PROT|nr:hypothetical protein [Rhodovibrio salinarum]MBK1697316.1 hypothetical protein [Rhodovibrio salinarum]